MLIKTGQASKAWTKKGKRLHVVTERKKIKKCNVRLLLVAVICHSLHLQTSASLIIHILVGFSFNLLENTSPRPLESSSVNTTEQTGSLLYSQYNLNSRQE